MTSKVSMKGLFEIASHEGLVINPYLDSVNVLTFGIGHTASAGSPNPASIKTVDIDQRDERIKWAFEVFKKDIAKFETRVNKYVKVPVVQTEFDALVSFDLNTGAIDTAQLTKYLNKGDRIRAAGDDRSGFMGWKKPASIIGRREKEQTLFATGKYSAKVVPIYSTNSKRKPVKIGELTYDQFTKLMGSTGEDTPVTKPVVTPPSPVIEKPKNLVEAIVAIFKSIFK